MARKRVLVLSGGAPNLTLMSGALLALDDYGLTFDAISMSGAGAVVGLCYLAPKGLTPTEALRNTMNFGVSDAIYSLLPINYKVFFKGGQLSEAFRNYLRNLPPFQYAEHQYGMSPAEKLESDVLLLAGSMATPFDLNFFDQGLCAHVPFIEDIVDFEKLNQLRSPLCFLNAYRIDTKQVVEFVGPEINIRHFRAAFSFPYLYAPYEIDGSFYYEAAAFTGLNLIKLAVDPRLGINWVKKQDDNVWRFIIFDVLGSDIIHPARNLTDAYAQSIIFPIVGNAEKEVSIFKEWVRTGDSRLIPPDERIARATAEAANAQPQADADARALDIAHALGAPGLAALGINPAIGPRELAEALGICPKPHVPDIKPYPVRFYMPPEQQPYVLDWSRSNLERLFDIGYESGRIFVQENPDILLP
jgi:predicted acylesterase/phospholipase RssA